MDLQRGFMTRSIVLLSALFLGCSVGEVPLNGGGGTDSGNGGGDGAAALCADRTTPVASHIHNDGGGTNAGQGCVAAGCHLNGNTGPGAPAFVMAGTLYKPDGVTPSGGVTIRLSPDAGGAKAIAVTDDAGNFSSAQAINPFPGKTLASGCPTADRAMSGGIVNASNGNCNGGTACHQVPGGLPMVLADQ
jgi:hypothetical protein